MFRQRNGTEQRILIVNKCTMYTLRCGIGQTMMMSGSVQCAKVFNVRSMLPEHYKLQFTMAFCVGIWLSVESHASWALWLARKLISTSIPTTRICATLLCHANICVYIIINVLEMSQTHAHALSFGADANFDKVLARCLTFCNKHDCAHSWAMHTHSGSKLVAEFLQTAKLVGEWHTFGFWIDMLSYILISNFIRIFVFVAAYVL